MDTDGSIPGDIEQSNAEIALRSHYPGLLL